MAEGDNAEEPSSVSRPGTTRKDSRKVPGGFGIDDEDDLSPTKPDFQNEIWQNENAHALNHSRLPSLDAALPPLPPGGSSFLSTRTDDGVENSEGHFDSLDEREMRRHLMDIESSILPAPSPIGAGVNPGVDDTYLFDGPPRRPEPPEEQKQELYTPGVGAAMFDTLSNDSAFSPSPKDDDFQAPAPLTFDSPRPADESTVNEGGDTTSSLETMSSPAAAAAARTISRALSVTSAGGYETANEKNYQSSSHDTDEENDLERTPRHPRIISTHAGDSSDEQSTVRYRNSNHSLKLSADAGSTPGAALLNGRSSGRRPKFLRSRHQSQRSSVSSFITNPDYGEGDMALGADYALQSGGAVPIGGMSRNSSYMLSRAISLGSIASGIDGSLAGTEVPSGDRALATLDEEERNRQRTVNDSKDTNNSPPETPRGTASRSLAPTDTVIARHVRNVQVPESAAKEYRSKNGLSPGRYSGLPTPSMGRNGKNLTLKEQSSTIDRLSKENWDLKLRIYFLSERLDKLSDEGVKDSISEIVELKTALATIQKDNKALKRKIKELEKKQKDEEGRPDTARSRNSSDGPNFDQEGAQEREEELIYLRERVEEYIIEVEKLRNESINREAEKRKLAELVRTMGERRGEDFEAREEMDVWKDLLEQETARREEADEDNRKLREEIFRLKTGNPMTGLSHTTNIYNITKKPQLSPSRPRSVMSERLDDHAGRFSAASTLAEDLRKESEQLRHENAELRREVGAQTSMLTSRNREKERLYQEIEDLKLGARRAGGSIAGDSILERSASRAHVRSVSRSSGTTRRAEPDDKEREDLENKNAEFRDKINALKLQNQELQRELEACTTDFEVAVEAKREAETVAKELQEELEVAENDLQTMQADRDEALRGQEEVEIEFESLRKEAQEEIDALEAEAEEKVEEIHRLQAELNDRSENFNALQVEMRALSESLVRLEDDHDAKIRRIQELEQELEESNGEIEEMDKRLVDANGKVDRLTVQQESSQGEIAFLREEQDADKIKIGDLESALGNAEASIRDEMERVKELEQRLSGERRQRDLVASKEKQDVQKIVNELNREASGAKDEARMLRKKLTSREVEATEWKERLMELENNLREALGDLNGTRSSLLKSIAKLQRELENTVRELDSTKASLKEKERLIQQRDGLLESHALESRRLSEALDKERGAHRNTKHQHDTFLTTHQHTTRTMTQHESRVLELETGRAQDRKKIASLENSFKDQMTERNNLLLTLWNRLSALCGTEWTHSNRLINGRALPSLEAVATMLPGFSKNLLAAVKNLETIIGGFPQRLKMVERDLWKEYQNIEHNLEMRTKRLDRLETVVKTSGLNNLDSKAADEIQRLRDTIRLQKDQITGLQKLTSRSRRLEHSLDPPSPAPSIPTGPRALSAERATTLTRTHSASIVETLERPGSSLKPTGSSSGMTSDEAGEQRWIFQLRELERRLKVEREGRLLDRNGARKRLQEGEKRNEELRAELERSKIRMQ